MLGLIVVSALALVDPCHPGALPANVPQMSQPKKAVVRHYKKVVKGATLHSKVVHKAKPVLVAKPKLDCPSGEKSLVQKILSGGASLDHMEPLTSVPSEKVIVITTAPLELGNLDEMEPTSFGVKSAPITPDDTYSGYNPVYSPLVSYNPVYLIPIGNIILTPVTPAFTAAVPEVATWQMLIGGVLCLGWLLRRKKSKQ